MSEAVKSIILPTGKVKASCKSPRTILFYAKPKQGKTKALSLLEDSLSIDTEKGADFVDSVRIQIDITKPEHEQAEEFVNICRAIYMAGYDPKTKIYTPKYKYLIVDTFTRLDSWSEIVGTLNFMEQSQGKKFNRTTDGVVLSPTHKQFESVHSIGQGYGYKHSREVMIDWYNKITMLAPRTIFVCHVKDKLVANNLGEAVAVKEINLTGAVKNIIASKVDTIMYGYRDGNKFMASFSSEGDGTRCSYLSGKQIVLTESNEDGDIITNNWDKIFID